MRKTTGALLALFLMTSNASAKLNRLIHEKSPYLLQHASNPVDWYPWGAEAFEKAQRENKPILVSIGYSTCHWCHVMERESYENTAIAAIMNRCLINIKVDREERPDVDKLYMTAVTALTGQGGWPLNVFLTPELKPFFGGTYFPPTARWGQAGWPDVVAKIGNAWQDPEERRKLIDTGSHLADVLQQAARAAEPPLSGRPEWLDHAFKLFLDSYDGVHGGFGPAPKFPMPVQHNFLLSYGARTHNARARDMSLHTLREMANGGIYDQIGGGFARYATDADWHVPHFEKMLYDNAQLAVNYTDAYLISGDIEFKRIALETLDYVHQDLAHPEGGFYSAEDADSLPASGADRKAEGAYYVWEKEEVMNLLGDKAGELFCFRFGVLDHGDVAQDPHGEFKNKNILHAVQTIPETARHFGISAEEAARQLEAARALLFKARRRRPRPDRDDKIISAWNGLMISAYARAYQAYGRESDLAAAQKAARFVRARLYDAKTRRLYRFWRENVRRAFGIADDYAFLAQGLIDLYEANFDPDWLAWAIELTESQNKLFYDPDKGGYFMTATDQDPHLWARFKEDQDNVEPAASSIAALNLLRLAQYADRSDFQEMAEKTLQGFGATLKETPRAMPQMLVALDFALSEPRQVVLAGKPGAPDTVAMLQTLRRYFIPNKIVILADGGPRQQELAKRLPFLEGIKPLQGKATAYVCIRRACKLPTADPVVFKKLLQDGSWH